MKIEAVIFDMDGLMLDTERLTVEAWDWTGEQLGFGPLGYMVQKTLGMNRQDNDAVFEREFGGKLSCETVVQKSKAYIQKSFAERGVPVKEGLFPLLQWLKENGYRLAVATSTGEKTARAELESAGILPYFDRMACGDMVERGKPAPDIYLKAAGMLGVAPENCLALEDSPNGIRAAFAAGMNPVVIPDLVEPDEEILQKSFRRLASLQEVRPLLEELR